MGKIACSKQPERLPIIVFPWGLTFRFLKQLAIGLWLFSPLLFALVSVILVLGYLAGKEEGLVSLGWFLLGIRYSNDSRLR